MARIDAAESLSDGELLSVIMGGAASGTAEATAGRLLAENNGGLLNLFLLDERELSRIEGIGPGRAYRLKAAAELSIRLSKARRRTQLCMKDAFTVAQYYMEQLRHLPQEMLMVSLYDHAGHLICDRPVTVGTLDRTLTAPREVFSFAVRKMAGFVILLHNHPGGDPAPSAEDKKTTRRMAEAGELLGIPLVDHIIIGDGTYYSFKENGQLAQL